MNSFTNEHMRSRTAVATSLAVLGDAASIDNLVWHIQITPIDSDGASKDRSNGGRVFQVFPHPDNIADFTGPCHRNKCDCVRTPCTNLSKHTQSNPGAGTR